MLKKFKSLSGDKKRLVGNFFSLSVLQGANYLLPLITLPYLVRVLGPEKFGLIAFAQAFIMCFNTLTDYGFNLSATREISINRTNKEKVSEIFNSVMIIKLILLVVSLVLMSIIVFAFEKFKKDWIIYYLTFGIVIGQALFPVWFFQGMERMKYITILNITAKLFFTISIFIFIHEVGDYIYVPLINSLGFLVAGILALWIVFKDFKIKFFWVGIEKLIYQLRDGWHIFLSQINVTLFSNSNVLILGLLTNDTAVGYFSAAEKIMRALAGLQVPIVGALFPHIAKLIKNSKKQAIFQLRKIIKYGTIIYLILVGLVFVFSKEIIVFFYSYSMQESAIILKIVAVVPLTIFLNNIFGTQIMLNTQKEKEFLKVLFLGGITNILLCSVLSYYFSYVGTAISLLFVEEIGRASCRERV